MNKFWIFLLVFAAVLLLAISACNGEPEIIVQTVVVKETVVVTATPSLTPVPTLTPWPTYTPTLTVPEVSVVPTTDPCLTNTVRIEGDVILPHCEDRMVEVNFTSASFVGVLEGIWQDSAEETWVYAFDQFLVDPDGGHHMPVELKVHIDDRAGQNGLPASLGNFGPETNSWVFDLTVGSSIQAWDGEEMSGHRFTVKMLDGEVASVLVADGFTPDGFTVAHKTFYLTVKDGELLWLEPIKTDFENLGATVLFYIVGCDDVEACAYFSSRLTGMPEGGDLRGGRYMTFEPSQILVILNGEFQPPLRSVDIVKVQ